jgi:peptidoglycan hydrolase-like protein with peptidoglycan-binding domain
MFYTKLFTFIFTFTILLSSIIISPKTQAAQSSNHKMPFRNTEIWRQDPIVGGGYGVHKDSKGIAYDLYAPSDSTMDILAPTDGIIGRGCTVNGATFISILSNEGDVLRFMHIDANTVIINQGEFVRVKQGEIIGKITGGGNYENATCKNSSDGPHLHFSWLASMCNFNIDGSIFECGDMKDCGSDEGLYSVPCNRKSPSTQFSSTNMAIEIPSNCDASINTDYIQGDYGLRIVKLQRCLTEKGLFNNPDGVTGFYGAYTDSILVKARNSQAPKLPTNPHNSSDDCNSSFNTRYTFGETSERVKVIQRCLQAAGFFSFAGGITGYLGNYTKTAIDNYVSSQNKSQSIQPNSSNGFCETLFGQSFVIGQSGDNVSKLQGCLKDKGHYKYIGGITGYFGTYTSDVLDEFLKNQNRR